MTHCFMHEFLIVHAHCAFLFMKVVWMQGGSQIMAKIKQRISSQDKTGMERE